MPTVYLSVGSNVNPEGNLRFAVRELKERFGAVQLSPVYRNTAVGFVGDDFLNLVAALVTEDEPQEIVAHLEAIHELAGRQRSHKRYAPRKLDIDFLLYGDEILEPFNIPRADVLKYAFVLGPLADIAGDMLHPISGRSYAAHWAEFDGGSHQMTAYDIDWQPGQPS